MQHKESALDAGEYKLLFKKTPSNYIYRNNIPTKYQQFLSFPTQEAEQEGEEKKKTSQLSET